MKIKLDAAKLAIVSALCLILLVLPQVLKPYLVGVLNVALIYGIAALGVSVMLGMGGQLSFAAIPFMGVGAYVVANACTGRLGVTLSTGAALLIAVLLAALLALLLGAVLFRLKDTYFTFATIALVQVSYTFFNNYKPLFGGPDGISGIPSLSLFGRQLANYNEWFYVLFAILLAAALIVERIRSTKLGRSLASIRDNEIAARTLGINVYQTKIIGFMLAGMLSALSGALYAMHVRFISADMFNYSSSTQVIIMAMMGGVNNTVGTIVGAILVRILPELFRSLQRYMQLIWGISVILLMVFMPSGISGLAEKLVGKVKRSKEKKKVGAGNETDPEA